MGEIGSAMDEKLLLELLAEAKLRGGGMILNVGEAPEVVVLSVEAYSALLAGKGTAHAPESLASLGTVPEQKTQTVLVTGGAGYIGGHVVRLLLDSGYKVVALDNLYTGRREHIPDGVTFIEGDVRDINLLRDVFAGYKIDAVAHLAALLEVGESVEKPFEYLDVNLLGTIKVLSAMQEAGVRRLLFSSTAAVYGSQSLVPIPELAVCEPNNPYGKSKLLAEKAVEYFTQCGELQATVFRYFNVAGKGAGLGVADTHHRSHLIPIVLDVARGSQEQLVVNGGDWGTPDGTCVRDYVHVLDIARAHAMALKAGVTEKFSIYNIGTGKGTSVHDVVQVATEVTGRMVPMQVGPRRAGDDSILVAGVDKIKKDLNFVTEHSTLEEIIRSSWAM